MLRFRPNILITPVGETPYAEDEWAGCMLRIGMAIVRVDRRGTRCVDVDVDPGTGRADAPLLKTIGRHRQARAGVYGTTVQPGLIQIGDTVAITS